MTRWVFNIYVRDPSLNIDAMPKLAPISPFAIFLSSQLPLSLYVGIDERDIIYSREINSRVVPIIFHESQFGP
jgi:hypothetical protein